MVILFSPVLSATGQALSDRTRFSATAGLRIVYFHESMTESASVYWINPGVDELFDLFGLSDRLRQCRHDRWPGPGGYHSDGSVLSPE